MIRTKKNISCTQLKNKLFSSKPYIYPCNYQKIASIDSDEPDGVETSLDHFDVFLLNINITLNFDWKIGFSRYAYSCFFMRDKRTKFNLQLPANLAELKT